MKLDNITLPNPNFGYETIITLPFYRSNLGNGEISIYDEGRIYDTWRCRKCRVVLSRDNLDLFFDLYNDSRRGKSLLLTEATASGFSPFTPLVPEGVGYTVFLDKVSNKGAIDDSAKRFAVEFDMMFKYSGEIAYNPITNDNCKDGPVVFGGNGLEIEGIRYPEGGYNISRAHDVFPVSTRGGAVRGQYYDKGGDSVGTEMKIECNEKTLKNVLYRLLYNFRSEAWAFTVPAKYFPFGLDKGDNKTFRVKLSQSEIKIKHNAFNQFDLLLKVVLVA